MTRKQIFSIAFMTASVFCALAVVPMFAQTDEPSLGEVARKNRAEHAKTKSKVKPKVTEENMPSRPMSTATVTNYGSSASLGTPSTDANSEANHQSAANAEGKNTTESPTNSDAPQGDSATAKSPEPKSDRVTQLKKDQESLNKIIDQLKTKLAEATSDSQRQTFSEVLRNAEQDLEKTQKELSDAEKSAPRN